MADVNVGLRPLVPWWQPLLIGILSVVFGIVVWIWPSATLYTFAVLVGLWLVTLGVSRLIGAFMDVPGRTTGQHVLSGVAGALYIIAGVICLRHLVVGLALIAVFVALQWLMTGIADITLSVYNRGAERVWLAVGGVLSLLLGVVFLSLPALSLSFFLVFTGITALVLGIVQISVAIRMRTAQQTLASHAVRRGQVSSGHGM
jgi:uncharacterized membrane protein HdeD (DUF308 family)